MKKTKFLGTITLLLLCFGIALLTEIPHFIRYQKGDIKAFESVAAGELKKGDLVQGEIDITDGCIATNEETNSTFGIETSRRTAARYYAVYMYNGNYILYQTGNQQEYDALDRIADAWEDYYDALGGAYNAENPEQESDLSDIPAPSETLSFTGTVKEMPDDLDAIFREWYGEGYDDECETVLICRADFSSYLRFVIIGAVCVILGIVSAVLTLIMRKKEKEYSY